MDTTTEAVADSTGVQSSEPEPGSEEAFQQLYEQGLLGDETQPQQTEEKEEQRQDDPEPPKEGEDAPEAKKDAEETEKQYESLDDFLKDSKLESESFLQLPVTVKVDGQEQKVPLSEVLKGYQLSSAGYNRMNELAQQKTAFTQEQQQVRQAISQRIQDTEALFNLAQQQLMGDYNRVDWNKLRLENPAEYAATAQDYNARFAAIQGQLQQIREGRQQEAQQAEQAKLQALQSAWPKLIAARPEWADQTKLAAAQKQIREFGTKLGFTNAELDGVYDYRYMLALDMAARYAQLQANAPATVKRVRTAPVMAKPGTRQVRDPKQIASQRAAERWAASGFRDDDAAAAVFEQFV